MSIHLQKHPCLKGLYTVGADAPGGPAERIPNNTLTPGESVTLYVFAGDFLL